MAKIFLSSARIVSILNCCAARAPKSACHHPMCSTSQLPIPASKSASRPAPQDLPFSWWTAPSPHHNRTCASSPRKPPCGTCQSSPVIRTSTFSRGSSPTPAPNFMTAEMRETSLCECSNMFLLGEAPHHRHDFEPLEIRRCPQTNIRDHLQQRIRLLLSCRSFGSKDLSRLRERLSLLRICLHGDLVVRRHFSTTTFGRGIGSLHSD